MSVFNKLKFWDKPPKIVKVLAIDGGGIRGIIPAMVLNRMEELTRKPICELFDLIGGTSTGGILAAGLVKPNKKGDKPQYKAREIVDLYDKRGGEIFLPRSTWKQIRSMGSWMENKYSPEGLIRVLTDFLGETTLTESLTDILITSYDIDKRTPFFIKSHYARNNIHPDFKLSEVAISTASAPTYFPPSHIEDKDWKEEYTLIDGGIFANNPAMCAYVEARYLYPDADGYLVVSLGTGEMLTSYPYEVAKSWGTLNWINPLFNIISHGQDATVHHQLQLLLAPKEDGIKRYYRFQIPLQTGKNHTLDDVSIDNLSLLKKVAQTNIIEPRIEELRELCKQLLAIPKTK